MSTRVFYCLYCNTKYVLSINDGKANYINIKIDLTNEDKKILEKNQLKIRKNKVDKLLKRKL